MINEVRVIGKEEIQTLVVPTEDYGIDFGALKKYCRENSIPYSNISDELASKFRKGIVKGSEVISNNVSKLVNEKSALGISKIKKASIKQQEYLVAHKYSEHYVASHKVISHKLPPHGHV